MATYCLSAGRKGSTTTKDRRYYATTKGRAARLLRNAVCRGQRSGRTSTIDLAFVQERLERGRCEVTGIPFDFVSNSPFVPSLDRRDNARGYTPENTQVVVLMYNNAKNAGTHADVLKLCEALCRTHART